MKSKTITCIVAKVEVVKQRINSIIDKVNDYIDSTEHGQKLKNNIKRITYGIGMVLCYVSSVFPVRVSADTGGDLTVLGGKIKEIFYPIVELLASLGYPTAYIMLIMGGLMVITGRKARGIEIIKWACIGYISLQLVPFLLNILEMIGKAMRGSVM